MGRSLKRWSGKGGQWCPKCQREHGGVWAFLAFRMDTFRPMLHNGEHIFGSRERVEAFVEGLRSRGVEYAERVEIVPFVLKRCYFKGQVLFSPCE